MTQPAVDYLEANRGVYVAMDRGEFAAKNFYPDRFIEIMLTEISKTYPRPMMGDAQAQVKLIISLYEQYDELKRQGLEITPNAKYTAPAPVRHFIEPARIESRY